MSDGYGSEAAMYPVLFDYLRSQGRFVLTQVPLKSYRADFMAFDVDWEAVRCRFKYGLLESLDKASIWRVLLGVRDNPRCTISDLAAVLRLSRDYVRAQLRTLEKMEVVEVTENQVRLLFWPDLVFKDMHVVEAKLGNWKRALTQAARYTPWASQLYVALPERLAEKLAQENPVRLARSGVGLLGVNGDVRLVRPSRDFDLGRYPVERHQLSEHLWSGISLALRRLVTARSRRFGPWFPVNPEAVPTDLTVDAL